ncbi:MAG TPA: hypothetical protein VIH03_06170 [Nitrososphaerales archaeon]
MEQEITFRVKFKPKARWVDQIYLGNVLADALATLSKQTNSFDFEVEREKEPT